MDKIISTVLLKLGDSNMPGKQAKVLSHTQIKRVINYLEANTRYSKRNIVMFLLSLHGLRAKEIANIKLGMIRDADGKIASHIELQDIATKGSSGRSIPIRQALCNALNDYLQTEHSGRSEYVVETERSQKFSPNAVVVFFNRLYSAVGMEGASSHSGRRTFITNCARKISLAGGSLYDVQLLAGHKSLNTTQRYIDYDTEAQRKVLDLAFTY